MAELNETDLLKKVRKIEIKTKALSHQIFAGEYHSAFKGRGMAFSEVREYQWGDDVRNMDWNVTARLRAPYVKVFEEERELTVVLLIDVSRSGLFGTRGMVKRDMTFISVSTKRIALLTSSILTHSVTINSSLSASLEKSIEANLRMQFSIRIQVTVISKVTRRLARSSSSLSSTTVPSVC